MRTGPAPARPVTSPSVTVTRGGVARAVDSVSVQRDLPSDLPASVTGGGGITAATGDVTWAAQAVAVKTRDDSPWTPGVVPLPGEAVTVDMDGGGGAHRVFTGAVDDSTGGTGKASSSRLIDHIYRLNRRVSVEPLLRLMHPATEGGDFRRMGLTPIYVVDRVMRACGYYTTPPAEWDSAVSVPLQTSVWPEHGTLTAAGSSAGSTNSHASFVQADGRMWAQDFTAEYAPRVGSSPKPITSAVQVSLSVGPGHAAGANDVTLHYGSTTVRLRAYSTDTVAAYLGGTQVINAWFGDTGWTRASLLIKDGVWTVRNDKGAQSTATQAVSGTTPLDRVQVSMPTGARVAGLVVSWPRDNGVDEHASLAFTPNARIRPGNVAYGLIDASPAIVNERALDVLLDISRAMCSPLWLDEDGVLQWAGPDVLRNQTPAVTVQARDSLLSLDWRVTLDHIRSTTTVDWKSPGITVGRYPWVTLWEGRKETLDVGSQIQQFVEVPGDEDWLGVDLPGLYYGGPYGDRPNRGIGSWVGGYGIASDGTPSGWFQAANGPASLARINHRSYLHSMTVNTLPSGAAHIGTEVRPNSPGLWPKWEGQSLPILRGYGKVTWNGTETEALPVNNGPVDRPELVHDAGPWVQRGTGAPEYGVGDNPARLANWIAQQVKTPTPEVTGFEIMPDPRIQLGGVINVADPDNLGIAFTALVVGVNLAQSGPGQSMNLSLRVIAANPTHTTYDQLQAAWSGANYDALEAAWAGQSYTALEANPLEETP